MTNSMRGAVNFTAGGATRRLALTTNAMCRYQDLADETVLEAVEGLQTSPGDFRRIRRLLFVGLDAGEEFTEADAGDLIDEIGLGEAGRLIGEAVQAAFPEAKQEGEESGNAPKGKKSASAPTT